MLLIVLLPATKAPMPPTSGAISGQLAPASRDISRASTSGIDS